MVLLLIVMNIFFGLSFTLGKVMLAHAKPLFIIAFRMTLGGIALLIYSRLTTSFHQKKFVRREQLLYLRHALFGVFGFYALRAWGLQFTSSATAAAIFAFFPLSTALFSWILKGMRYSWMQIVGLLIGFTGVILVLTEGQACTRFMFSCGVAEMAVAIATCCLSIGIITVQELMTDYQADPLFLNGITMLGGGLLAGCVSYATESTWIHGDAGMLLLLVLIQTLLSNFLCANLQAYLLRVYSATTMSCTSFIAPLSSISYGVIFLSETCSWHLMLSVSCIIFGIMCYHGDHIHHNVNLRFKKWYASLFSERPV